MRIATLQFAPQLGRVSANIARADELLKEYSPGEIDLLVLPEMAFSGYNFPSLDAIRPYLEPTAAGPTAQWAKATAARLRCVVSVGYPEIEIASGKKEDEEEEEEEEEEEGEFSLAVGEAGAWNSSPGFPPCYNSTITVSPLGDILAHYRKTHLYYTDKTWAEESPTGWLTVPLNLPFPFPSPSPSTSSPQPSSQPPTSPTLTSFGICMDLNPYQFTSAWHHHELATHTLATSATLLILSNAWLTTLPSSALHGPSFAHKPDHETWRYWCARLEPLIRRSTTTTTTTTASLPQKGNGGKEITPQEEEHLFKKGQEEKEHKVVVVLANRCGEEGPDARYAGTSWVGMLGGDEVKVWGMLGRGEEKVLVVDTDVRRL